MDRALLLNIFTTYLFLDIFLLFAHAKRMKEILFITLIAGWVLEWFVYVDTARKGKEGLGKTLLLKSLISITFIFCIFISFFLRSYVEEPMEFTQHMGIIFLSQGLFIRYWTYYIIKPYFSR